MPIKIRYYLIGFAGAAIASICCWDAIVGLFFLFGWSIPEYLATKYNAWPSEYD